MLAAGLRPLPLWLRALGVGHAALDVARCRLAVVLGTAGLVALGLCLDAAGVLAAAADGRWATKRD